MRRDVAAILIAAALIAGLVAGLKWHAMQRITAPYRMDYDSGPLCPVCHNSGVIDNTQVPCTCSFRAKAWRGPR